MPYVHFPLGALRTTCWLAPLYCLLAYCLLPLDLLPTAHCPWVEPLKAICGSYDGVCSVLPAPLWAVISGGVAIVGILALLVALRQVCARARAHEIDTNVCFFTHGVRTTAWQSLSSRQPSWPCPACAGCVCDGDLLWQGLRISLRRPQPCPDVVAGASLGRRVGRRLCCVSRSLCCLRCSLAKGVRVGARAARPDGFDYVELRGSGSSTRRRRVGLLPTSQPVPPAGGPVSLTSHSSNSGDAAGGGSTAEQQPPEFLSLFSFVLCGYRLLSLVRALTRHGLCVCVS
jgi:hypothetical protein